jgi:hypothetical protein
MFCRKWNLIYERLEMGVFKLAEELDVDTDTVEQVNFYILFLNSNSFLCRTACEHMLHQMFYVDFLICMIYGTAQITNNILLFFLKFVVEISVYFNL